MCVYCWSGEGLALVMVRVVTYGVFLLTSLRITVMILLASFFALFLWFSMAGFRSALVMMSPDIRMKGSDLTTSFLCSSRRASPGLVIEESDMVVTFIMAICLCLFVFVCIV